MRLINQLSEQGVALPLDLSHEAAKGFPAALTFALAMEADRSDLKVVKEYLIRRQGMSQLQAECSQCAYLRYLVMIRSTGEHLAPSEEADAFWHAHILHTRQYGEWCNKHFGRYLHHAPSAPGFHPSEEFLRRQCELGELFFGANSIYRCRKGECYNSHGCVDNSCTLH